MRRWIEIIHCAIPLLALLLFYAMVGTGHAASAPRSDTASPSPSNPATPHPNDAASSSSNTSSTASVETKDPAVLAVKLPDDATYALLVESSGPKRVSLAAPISANGPRAAIEVPGRQAENAAVSVSAIASSSGRMARKPVAFKGLAASVTFTRADFNLLSLFTVQVRSGGRAVSTGLVTLVGPKGETVGEAPLLPDARGLVTFTGVPAGRNTIRVTYNDGQIATQEISVDPSDPPERRRADLIVSGAKATVPLGRSEDGAGSSGGSTRRNERAAPGADSGQTGSGQSGTRDAVGFFMALGTLVLLGLGGRMLWRSRPDLVRKALARLPHAVEEEEPIAPAQAPPPVTTPPGTCSFCGSRKDPVTGSCECSPETDGARAAAIAEKAADPVTPIGPRLSVLSGPRAGRSFALGDAGLTVGRDAASDVALVDDRLASRRHARVTRSGDAWIVRDEGSSNGVFVNGAKVAEATLRPGDGLTIGETRLRFDID